ncbi:hypothetical protein BDV25DRAFT_148735 [Aspergillus avenaceus]|uniref:Uncharacterized protein n=1 Tax=Aspergillus avenaceus TaxID=36643 RepID=A0A5N6U538_ASPAV|nr:hypothetical protein BDV25DRAFT_148735 [Aspergillus avenaceus]
MPKSLRALRRSRKYQIWSARMALQASGSPSRTRLRWPVPPGSPKSEMLASLSSLPSSLAKLLSGKTSTVIRASILRSNTVMSSDKGRHKRRRNGVGYRIKGVGIDEWQPVSAPDIRGSPQIKATHSMLESDHIHAQKGSPQSELNEKEERLQERQGTKRNRQSHAVVPMRDLSDWEIMMIDGLDRKLGWLSSQLLPGRRPFHFAMLPNHWLNTRTWIVYDPASRAPLDVKRRLGDPRFNKPYPKPDLGRKRRCPKVNPKIAHTPHINSWREAVNKNRKASGLKDLVKPVDLFDGSAEDPPGGQFDPACWMLRKPPQAFSLSSRQKETYYEGGAGWQEKLIDWQNVRRGYRVRKLIHEGRANRTRTKEVALSVTRCTNARMHDMP